MKVWGLINSAFWAGFLLQMGPGQADAQSPLEASSASRPHATLGTHVEHYTDGEPYDPFQLAKKFSGAGNTLQYGVRGQEPDTTEASGSQGHSLYETPALVDYGQAGCACSGAGSIIGNKRVINSLFELESAQPVSVIRLRFDAAYDLELPDRAEFYWAKTVNGRGPRGDNPPPEQAERSVDFQDFNAYMETAMGEGTFSMFTEVPIRVLDPDVNDNTAGLSDIVVGTKAVLMDHDEFQISFLFKTFIPSGVPRRGLGTGHTSLQPGFLGRWQLCEQTWLHGEFSFWFPLGGDSDFSGEVLRYGLGISHLMWEWNTQSKDCYRAVIPTIEVIGWSVLDGQETNPDSTLAAPDINDPDPASMINIQPGVRVLCGPNKDFGISAAFAVTENHWYEQLYRFEFRWFF